jgi:predicted nucleic acid-binding protein
LGVDRLRALLRRRERVAFDTSVFIYHLQANPKYVGLTQAIFSWLEGSGSSGITSTITMMELLVQPYRNQLNQQAGEFYGLLSTYPNLDWVAPSLEVADLGARLRAQHGLKTPDALHAATAVHGHAGAMLTNDPVFRRLKDFETVLLDEFL